MSLVVSLPMVALGRCGGLVDPRSVQQCLVVKTALHPDLLHPDHLPPVSASSLLVAASLTNHPSASSCCRTPFRQEERIDEEQWDGGVGGGEGIVWIER